MALTSGNKNKPKQFVLHIVCFMQEMLLKMLYYQIITSITTDRNIRLEVLRMHRNCYQTRTNDKKTYYCALCCTDHNLIVQSATEASPTVPCSLQQFVCLSNCLFHIFLQISAQAQISISLAAYPQTSTGDFL